MIIIMYKRDLMRSFEDPETYKYVEIESKAVNERQVKTHGIVLTHLATGCRCLPQNFFGTKGIILFLED